MCEEKLRIVENLNSVIKASGLSYAALGEKTGIAKSSIQRYATGKVKNVSIENCKKIAEACGASIDDVLGVEKKTVELSHDEMELISAFRELKGRVEPGFVESLINLMRCFADK